MCSILSLDSWLTIALISGRGGVAGWDGEEGGCGDVCVPMVLENIGQISSLEEVEGERGEAFMSGSAFARS